MKKTTIYLFATIAIIVLVVAVYVHVSHQEADEFEGGDFVDDLGYSLTLTSPP